MKNVLLTTALISLVALAAAAACQLAGLSLPAPLHFSHLLAAVVAIGFVNVVFHDYAPRPAPRAARALRPARRPRTADQTMLAFESTLMILRGKDASPTITPV